MEDAYDKRDIAYFKKMVRHEDFVVRTRAVCILADIGDEDVIDDISYVLLNDPNELVRHEAAFSLGQMGFKKGLDALAKAVENDPSMFVRHEAAIAIGVIGSEEGRITLEKALNDKDKEVRESAIIALSNIDYVSNIKKINKFTRLTGG
ncbi:MAG: HEAT repeat domain-containing protein [Candidatus Nitrosothermus koennekii]|nr:MAG: HEAT repeat domain-containing protein [Candidatus Nitrosothermus koennekii]